MGRSLAKSSSSAIGARRNTIGDGLLDRIERLVGAAGQRVNDGRALQHLFVRRRQRLRTLQAAHAPPASSPALA